MRHLSSLNPSPLALPTTRQPAYSQLPSQIPVAFALPFRLKLALPLTLFLQLVLLLLARIGTAALKHLLEPVADHVSTGYMASAIRPQIAPRKTRKTLLDLVLIQFLDLPPCDGA